MKKVIAAAAGLALVGSMATVASAAVSVSGEMRVRAYVEDNDATGDTIESVDQRARLAFKGTAAGGASVYVRTDLSDDQQWNGAVNTSKELNTDQAYITVPMGNVTIKAGRMSTGFSQVWSKYNRVDRLMISTKAMGGKLAAIYDVDENIIDADADSVKYGALYAGKMAGMKVKAIGFYMDKATENGSDIKGSVRLMKKISGFDVTLDYKYIEGADVAEDQTGISLSAATNMAGMNIRLTAAATEDDCKFDNTYGELTGGWMIGGADYSPISKVDKVGMGGDTTVMAIKATKKVSDKMTLFGSVANYDLDTETAQDMSEFNIGLNYAISDGATLTAVVADLDDDDDSDGSVSGSAAMLRMQVKF